MTKIFKLTTGILLLLLVSCQNRPGTAEALAEADSLYAIGRESLENYPAIRAILYFQRAIDALPDDTASVRRKTALFNDMGSLLIRLRLYQDAINKYLLAHTCATETNDSLSMIESFKGMGDAYQMLNNVFEAMLCLDKAEQMATSLKADEALASIALHKALISVRWGKFEQADKQLPRSPFPVSEADKGMYHYVMWHLFNSVRHNQDSLNYHYSQLTAYRQTDYLGRVIYWKLQQAISQHDFRKADQLLAQRKLTGRELERNAEYEASGAVAAVYQALHAEREKADLLIKNQRIRFYAVMGILSSILIIAIFLILLYHSRSERMRVERNNALLEKYNESLRADLETERAKATQLQPDADSMSIAIRESDIYQHLLKTEKPMSDAEAAKAVALVDRFFPDFNKRLVTFGVIKEHEVRMCYLVKMGFKTSRMALLLSRSDSAISNGRTRLYKKVFGKEGNGEDWDKVIQSL